MAATLPAVGHVPARASGARAGTALTIGLAVAAWAALWVWESSAAGRYLAHDAGAGSLSGSAALGVFVAGWVLMLAAMMLPTTVPLVSLFSRAVARRPDAQKLTLLVLGGYVMAWTVAGLLAYGADLGLHAADDRSGVVGDDGWVLAVAALALAGGYQLSALKQRCLHLCRSPRTHLMTHWHGRQPAAEAVALGAAHARTCIGCCWPLMLVLFGVGAGSLGWMLALGAAMTAEKVAPFGAALRVPISAALFASAAVVAVVNV